jgi:flavin reductase (DIM6/NTAB) family NADH-FMN oxidoreductase RutF
MSKVVTEDVGKFSQHYPKMAVIVTANAHGRDDAMTATWHSSISLRPPLYGVAITSKRFTYELITESQEFGISFIRLERASLAAAIGGTSGKKMDKFRSFDIKRDRPLKTTAPILKDAYAAYECKLVDDKPYGDHLWIVGEIVAIHFLEEAFGAGEVLDLDKIKPLLYVGSDHYVTADGDSMKFIERGI